MLVFPYVGLSWDEYAWNHTRLSRLHYTPPCRSGSTGRNPCRRERMRSWKACWDCLKMEIDMRGSGLCLLLLVLSGVLENVWIQKGHRSFHSWMWAAPNSRHVCGRKIAFLGIWKSWRLTAVGSLIIHRLCFFKFKQKEVSPKSKSNNWEQTLLFLWIHMWLFRASLAHISDPNMLNNIVWLSYIDRCITPQPHPRSWVGQFGHQEAKDREEEEEGGVPL